MNNLTMKIKYASTKGVEFDAINVPVDVCGTQQHIIVPFVVCPKHLMDEKGHDHTIWLKNLSPMAEDLLINYYNMYILRRGLALLYTKSQTKIKNVFSHHRVAFYGSWLNDFLKSVGMKPIYGGSPKINNLVDEILNKFELEQIEDWGLAYIDDYFSGSTLMEKYSSLCDNVFEAKLIDSLSNEDVWNVVGQIMQSDGKWKKAFFKQVFIPFVLEQEELEKKKQQEIEKAEKELQELEKAILEKKEKLACLKCSLA